MEKKNNNKNIKKKNKVKGFTLIELLAIIVIIGIIALIGSLATGAIMSKSKISVFLFKCKNYYGYSI